MAWWGKLLGGTFGFMMGGPLGAILGTALGHGFDKGLKGVEEAQTWNPGERERIQTAFFTATFSVLGHIAKADGRVSDQEIGLTRHLMDEMDLTPEMRRTAIRLFNEGKAPGFPLDEVLEQFRHECHRRQTLIQMFLEIQLQGAYADGHMDPAEEQLLRQMAGQLGFSELAFRRLERMVWAQQQFAGAGAGGRRRPPSEPAGPSVEDAYAVLNVAPEAGDAEVKKAYRRLISQHHPDKLVSKGLPEEMMRLATRKTHEIRQAYEAVKTARGMR
jgi:DnaJ like chaperone protein